MHQLTHARTLTHGDAHTSGDHMWRGLPIRQGHAAQRADVDFNFPMDTGQSGFLARAHAWQARIVNSEEDHGEDVMLDPGD